MWPSRGRGRPLPERSSCWREGARGTRRGAGGEGGAGQRGAAGTRRAAECALLAGSGKYGLQAAPLLSPASLSPSLPSLLPPLLLLSPPSLDVGCRLEPGGTGRGTASPPREEGLRRGRLPCGRMARAWEGRRAAGGSGGPQPPTPRRQLKMTGRENSSDIRGQPAPGRRFQGAASNPPPTPGPRKPLQRLRTRRPCSDSSTALFRLS
nr:uncharacterized protein LOC132417497 [Delphinus delphis]